MMKTCDDCGHDMILHVAPYGCMKDRDSEWCWCLRIADET